MGSNYKKYDKRSLAMSPIEGDEIDLPAASQMTAEELDHTPFKQGRYMGHTPSKVAEWNLGWIVALYENVEPKRVSYALYKDCKADAMTSQQYRADHDADWDDSQELDFQFDYGRDIGDH